MPSAPASPVKSLSQKAARLIVWLGPTDGTKPTSANEVDWLIPQQMSITAGSSRDDVLSFVVDLAKLGARLVDTTAPVNLQRQVELRTLDDNGDPNVVLGWGFLAKNPQAINSDAESTSFEARIANFHFGKRLTTYPVWRVYKDIANARLDVMRPLVFNPEIDEKIEPNMSSIFYDVKNWNYVIDPESLRTTASQEYQDQTASLWKISDAALALCWWLNPDETYIKNPTWYEVREQFAARNELLKNVEIPMGSFLPEALDALLGPFEYGWHLVHTGGFIRQTTIKFFARGEGVKRPVLLQRPGELRDIKKTNVAEFDAVYDIFELANIIEVHGGFLKRESTFELKKGWKTEYDTKDLPDISKGEAFYEEHPSVGRKWILNEAGDYTNLREEITEPYSFDDLFPSPQQIRRRRFQRCLSQHPDADDLESNGYVLQWYDSTQDDAVDPDVQSDPGWVRVTWPFSVLEKECGISFEGPTPPGPLWDLIAVDPTTARLRITATVVGDQRLKGIATKRASSPNAQDVPLVLDLQDRFQFSKVETTSIFSGRPSIARDDTTAIQTYAESVRDIEDACHIHCSVTLEGIAHPQYSIGDLIDNVKGRNLTLNAFSPSGGANTRNPQIVGFVWHLAGNQRLELLLDSFERERPQIIHENGRGGQQPSGGDLNAFAKAGSNTAAAASGINTTGVPNLSQRLSSASSILGVK